MVRFLWQRRGFLCRDQKQAGGFVQGGFPLFRYAARDETAAVTVEELEEDIDHEVETKNAKREEYGEAHGFHARTDGVLPPR